jgi:DNA polymerase III epsilon subunit-like protein
MKHGLSDKQCAALTQLAQSMGRTLFLFDLETTGLLQSDSRGRPLPVGIVEFGYLSADMDGEISHYSAYVDPEIPIPVEASNIHGITSAEVAGAQSYPGLHMHLHEALMTCAVGGFNTRLYDIPVLRNNAARYQLGDLTAPLQIDVRDVWIGVSGQKRGKLSVVAGSYGVDVQNAHRAMGDVLTTAALLANMIEHHGLAEVMRHGCKNASDAPSDAPPSGWASNSVSHGVSHGGTSAPVRASAAQTVSIPAPRLSPLKPVTVNKSGLVRSAILDYLTTHKCLGQDGIKELAASVAERSQTRPEELKTTLSFALGEMLAKGQIRPEQVADQTKVSKIGKFLPEAIQMAGGDGYLRPIKEALDRLTGENTDYVQLRVALDTAGRERWMVPRQVA